MFHQSLMPPAFVSKSVAIHLPASLMALAFFVLILAAQPVGAATITVTTTADSGAGSLRQSVADANATTEADTINFNIPLSDPNCDSSNVCTITLTGGVITIQAAGGSLTIANQAGASKLLISGNDASRVFEGGLGANVALDGLTITRGVSPNSSSSNSIGVVGNFRGTLTIMNSVFTRNSGAAVIFTEAFGISNGILNVTNTTIDNNTAIGILLSNSISSGGTLNVVNSTISNNKPPSGDTGGIRFVGDQLRMTNSTVSGNSSSIGGIYVVTVGGSPNTSFVITNCTITGNTGKDGAGGIEVFRARLNLRNSIVSGNTNSSGAADIRFYTGVGVSLGHNLIGAAPDFVDGRITYRGQWLPSDMLNTDARLAPLGNNGGATETHALLPDSPAINNGDNTEAPATDQRAFTRIVGGTIDIGAYEFGALKDKSCGKSLNTKSCGRSF